MTPALIAVAALLLAMNFLCAAALLAGHRCARELRLIRRALENQCVDEVMSAMQQAEEAQGGGDRLTVISDREKQS